MLITFATLAEAAPTISLLGAQPSPQAQLYTFAGGEILVTGMGALNAAIALSAHVGSHQQVWNVGICGALDPSLSIGDILTVGTCVRYLGERHLESSSPVKFAQDATPPATFGKGVTLCSVDIPIHTNLQRDSARQVGDIVDMEGYGIAQVCIAHQIPLLMWKGVSDIAGEDTKNAIAQNLAPVAEKLAHHVSEVRSG